MVFCGLCEFRLRNGSEDPHFFCIEISINVNIFEIQQRLSRQTHAGTRLPRCRSQRLSAKHKQEHVFHNVFQPNPSAKHILAAHDPDAKSELARLWSHTRWRPLASQDSQSACGSRRRSCGTELHRGGSIKSRGSAWTRDCILYMRCPSITKKHSSTSKPATIPSLQQRSDTE